MSMRNNQDSYTPDPIKLEVYKHFFSVIAEEMGANLRKASFSPNIKERRDYSCAIFDDQGSMVAQAAHIPVHLGSMPLSVKSAIEFLSPRHSLQAGDTIILNDPYLGGTHLPDVTLVTPVFLGDENNRNPRGYVASRAHHADIGGMTPGSMPIAREIFQEGLIIPPVKLVAAGQLNEEIIELILANVRTPDERIGDINAQIGANQRGVDRLKELFLRYGEHEVSRYMVALQAYTEKMTRRLISDLPDGSFTYTDYLDNNGIDDDPIPIKVSITIRGDQAVVDFTGSASQQQTSINAVFAITLSAVNYVFRSLIGLDVPNNSGCLSPVQIVAPQGTVVNSIHPAPVAGGNVETSQRIVDVLLGALAQACPERIPAASQGTMNNVLIGGWNPNNRSYFTYYETIGGGSGASAQGAGASAVHSHMTNTLNTPIEALEYSYPLQVRRYSIRNGSGGKGHYPGGNGIIREIELLSDAQITLLTERRVIHPYGLQGGEAGECGENILSQAGKEQTLGGKCTLQGRKNDVLRISTPGGGGYGKPSGRE
jgi:N-methylhydantoinase B